MAIPVHKQPRVFNGRLLNLLIHAAHRVIQLNVSSPLTEPGRNITRIDAKHCNVLFRRLKFKVDGDAERVEGCFGGAIADVRSAIVVFI